MVGGTERILERKRLDGLRGLKGAGEGDLIGDLIDLFLSATPARIERMRAAIANQNWSDLSHVAHGLKGSCAYLGATAMEELSRRLEACGKSGDGSQAAAVLTELEGQYVLAGDALRVERAAL